MADHFQRVHGGHPAGTAPPTRGNQLGRVIRCKAHSAKLHLSKRYAQQASAAKDPNPSVPLAGAREESRTPDLLITRYPALNAVRPRHRPRDCPERNERCAPICRDQSVMFRYSPVRTNSAVGSAKAPAQKACHCWSLASVSEYAPYASRSAKPVVISAVIG